jgi:hypothetical protein
MSNAMRGQQYTDRCCVFRSVAERRRLLKVKLQNRIARLRQSEVSTKTNPEQDTLSGSKSLPSLGSCDPRRLRGVGGLGMPPGRA